MALGQRKKVLRKKKFLIGGIIVIAAIIYLGVMGFQSSATYYYRVSEVAGRVKPGINVKVNGEIAPGSLVQEPGRTLKFTLTEGGQSLPVVYQGAVPDTFGAANEVVVEGRLGDSGVFQASGILTKCPSKYTPQ